MSEEHGERADTLAASIATTIGDWLARNGGGFSTGFTLGVDYIDEDGDHCWAVASQDGQTPTMTLGMLRFHTLSVEHDVEVHFGRLDG